MWSSSCADVKDVNIWLPRRHGARSLQEALAPSHGLGDSPPPLPLEDGALGGGEQGWGERPRPRPWHLHQGPETCLQSQLDKRFSVKETQGVTLSICSPLHSATEERLASLLQGGGQSLPMDSGTLRREPGQKACVPISEDGLAPTVSGAFYMPAECRQSAHFFKNELSSSWSALATGT